MYCPECGCEFVGWTGRCPVCKVSLVKEPPQRPDVEDQPISYDELIDLVNENGGELSIDLSTTSVGKEKKWSFPYNGYGYAWARKMVGSSNDFSVELDTVEVGKDKSWRFPYLGYGFAWEKGVVGNLGGNEVTAQAIKVGREKKWRIPYLGYGRAWTEEMRGKCGERLRVHLLTTEVGRSREWRFPYRGYGFGWIKKAVLTLTLGK